VKAVVLVGGEGTRLRPLTSTTPKPLLPIAGRPLLERQLLWLASHGVIEVVLSLGYLPDAFVEHFPGDRFGPIQLRYAVEPQPLGTAGAVRFAADSAGIDERFVVCNGDVLTTLDLDDFVEFHVERGATATVHLAKVEDPSALGAVPTYPDGEVKAFVEKPPPGMAPTDWINAGTYVLEPEVLELIPSSLAVSIERETFPRLLDARGKLYARGTDDYWLDVGTPENYLQANTDVLTGHLGLPPVPDAREAAPGVWLQGSADVAGKVVLEAPLLVGPGVSVGSGTRLVGATVGPGCSIGQDVVVDRSVLLSGARVADRTRIQSSIVGTDASLEEDVTVLDRSIIGAHARVGAGTILAGGRVPVPAPAG
jgi:mannose-1-phosphate guanylyltransferase